MLQRLHARDDVVPPGMIRPRDFIDVPKLQIRNVGKTGGAVLDLIFGDVDAHSVVNVTRGRQQKCPVSAPVVEQSADGADTQ
jgi:hypothetical protein